ncbi:MAG: tRNA glutamyl-Q(34) synthetase GluQRS [Pseudomonadota bacterium]
MRTRFAPSPTGYLHLGHAYSASVAFELAEKMDGICLLRIEDIDQPRSKAEYEQAIYDDLNWLGYTWPTPVLRQSDRFDAYKDALTQLTQQGLAYPCSCNRSDIKKALSATQEGEVLGPDGLVYPGTCRINGANPDKAHAIRLDMEKALQKLPDPISYVETSSGQNVDMTTSHKALIGKIGDIVLARKDIGTSYHLSVVVDDAYQEIDVVVRGEDMADQTPIHRVLHYLLDLKAPVYHHHQLIRDTNGKRLAKRDDARAIRKYREDGHAPEDIKTLYRF